MELKLDEAVQILERTPTVLETMLLGLGDCWLSANEGEQTFTPVDVVGHLLLGEEEDWIPRILTILRHGETRPFPPFDRFGFVERHKGKTLMELLRDFAILRENNIMRLKDLNVGSVDMKLTGIHPEFGRVTLSELIATWVVHDLTHMSQVVRVLAKQYAEAVGPWKAYLGILIR